MAVSIKVVPLSLTVVIPGRPLKLRPRTGRRSVVA